MLQKRINDRKSLVHCAGMMQNRAMKTYLCLICGYVYSEEEGDPEFGIEPRTRWEDVPLSWRCPDCGAGKEDFEMVVI